MSVPSSGQVQFNLGSGRFTVDSITDPNHAPRDVLDIDLGFVIRGTVYLPNWLVGTGQVCVYAQEIGGPTNKSIGCDTSLKFTRAAPAEPKLLRHDWTVTIAPGSKILPDPQRGGSQVYNLVAVFVFDDQLTDIGAFVDMGKYLIN